MHPNRARDASRQGFENTLFREHGRKARTLIVYGGLVRGHLFTPQQAGLRQVKSVLGHDDCPFPISTTACLPPSHLEDTQECHRRLSALWQTL
jgi:hypothetical protein